MVTKSSHRVLFLPNLRAPSLVVTTWHLPLPQAIINSSAEFWVQKCPSYDSAGTIFAPYIQCQESLSDLS
jgi:hypothetical protein